MRLAAQVKIIVAGRLRNFLGLTPYNTVSRSFLKIRRTLKILDPGLRKLVLTLPPKLNSTRSVKEYSKRSTLPMKLPWLHSDESTTTPIAMLLSLESKLTL